MNKETYETIDDIQARGGNPDEVDYERVSDRLADGWCEDEVVNAELRRQKRRREDK
jgi:hypothetical protein